MKNLCEIKICGMHINLAAKDAISSAFEEKKNDISIIARDEFDSADCENDFLQIKMLLEDLLPEKVAYPETEFITTGEIECDGDVTKISFRDSIGNASAKPTFTTFCLFPNKIMTMIKSDNDTNCLSFQSGKRIQYDYNAKLDSPVTIFTRELTFSVDGSGGYVHLDYFIEVNGISFEHDKFDITIKT